MNRLLVFIFVAFYATASLAQSADEIVGIWWNEEKTSKIEVKEVDGKYIGTIVYMIPEKYENGEPPKDDENPDPALRERSVLGLQILEGFVYDAKEKEWEDGKIYDPKSGNTYACYAWMDNKDELNLKGYVAGIRWLGRKSIWHRTEL